MSFNRTVIETYVILLNVVAPNKISFFFKIKLLSLSLELRQNKLERASLANLSA